QGTLHLTDDLNFTGGLRYTRDNKPVRTVSASVGLDGQLTSCRFAVDSGVPNAEPFPNCAWSNSDQYEFISWTAGFDYKINEDLMAYLKGSSADRAGGQNTRGLDLVSTQPFDPESATDIEVGFKGQFFDRTLQVNAAYYH